MTVVNVSDRAMQVGEPIVIDGEKYRIFDFVGGVRLYKFPQKKARFCLLLKQGRISWDKSVGVWRFEGTGRVEALAEAVGR